MTRKLVNLCVTESNAIYIDETRITDRSTKPWGAVATLFEAEVREDSIVSTLIKNGYKRLLSKIDTEPYLSQAKTVLEKTQ